MQLVVLNTNFWLDSAVTNLKTTKAFVVIIRIEYFSSLANLLEELIPVLNVLSKHLENFILLHVPKRLVRFPGFVISVSLSKHSFKDFVGLLDTKGLAHFYE